MNIRWNNIAALILAVVIIVLLAKNGPAIGAFLGSMKDIGPGHTAEEKTIGLIAFGLIGACLVAIVRILTHNRDK